MNFTTITEEEFRDFAKTSPYQSFMQTPEIAKLREKDGWTIYYLAVKQSEKIVAATMLLSKPTFLKKSTFYSPGGPLIDYEDVSLVNFFIRNLKTFIKQHGGYVLHIDPYYELIERDRNGEKVEGGFNHSTALKNLEQLGFKPIKNPTQPKYLFVMDINNRTPEALFADFKRNTRNHIRKAEKQGVKVRELERTELSTFKTITESTSTRRNFKDRTLSYYEEMYDLFHNRGEVQFLIAEANDIPLSAAMFILYGDEVIYLFSGSDEKYMREYNAQYAIQWHMIKYAAEHCFKKYNFYGINGLPDPNSKDYGIYEFKKGFGGHVVELIGSFELPITPLYNLHQILSNLKNHKK